MIEKTGDIPANETKKERKERIKKDIWYVENWSLLLDLKILFLTVWRTLRRDGINHPGADTMEEFMGRG